MSSTISDTPGGGWTLAGIAFCQVSDARERLLTVAGRIMAGDTVGAGDELAAITRQLEAAGRHLA